MARGRPATAIVHRVVRAPGPVRLELEALTTWRDVHGERFGDGDPAVATVADGFTFEDVYRVRGPAFAPGGAWYRGVRAREEAARGLGALEDLWFAGRFVADLQAGETAEVTAWAGDLADLPPPAATIVAAAKERAEEVARRAAVGATDAVGARLAIAADQLVVAGPTVVAGYPWFGDWSRDTMTSYEGLLLATGRADEGRELLLRAAASLSEGMLANTADAGGTEYNTVDGTLWFLHALDRHVDATADLDLVDELAAALQGIVDHHVAGTRFGIRVDPSDGLLTQGAEGWALTWMDAAGRWPADHGACGQGGRGQRAVGERPDGSGRPARPDRPRVGDHRAAGHAGSELVRQPVHGARTNWSGRRRRRPVGRRLEPSPQPAAGRLPPPRTAA